MTMTEPVLFAYTLNGDGYGSNISMEQLTDTINSKQVIWLHMDYSSIETQAWLNANDSLDEWVVESMTEEDVRARAVIKKGLLYACLRSLNCNREQEHEDMISMRVFIRDNLIITARKRELGVMKGICSQLEAGEGPSSPVELLSYILFEINEIISDHITSLVDSLDEAEQNYLLSPTEVKRDDISNLRRKTLLLKRHLGPQKEALKTLCTSDSPMLKPHRQGFEEHYQENTRLLEELDLTRERCSLLQEQIGNRLSEQLNLRMYIFSMITAVFLPISSVASLFGMNLGGIPGTNSPWGFSLLCAALVFTSTLLILFLKKKQWF